MAVRQRTQATIHLDRLERNIRNIQRRMKAGVELMAVVKGNAYSHGIAGLYETFRRCGVQRYAVAVWEEGAALRQAGAVEPILVLGDIWDEQLPQLLQHDLTATIFCVETAEKLNALAARAGKVHPIHIKLDTGMSRIGFACCEASVAAIRYIAQLPHLRIEGIFTHFARADELDVPVTEQQFDRFCSMVDTLRQAGVDIPLVHAANSASILLRPEVQLDVVRAGDILYGLSPVDETVWAGAGFEEVLTWETYVVMVKTVPEGTQVGYGGTFTTRRTTRIATIPVGFADGYSRSLSNKGAVIIRGQEAPILGRVCMDQMMVDVTDIPGVARGEEVTLLGKGMSIARMAELLSINVDEIVCNISGRVRRVYTRN